MLDTFANLKYFQYIHLETKLSLFYIKFAVLAVVMINIVVFWVMKMEAVCFFKRWLPLIRSHGIVTQKTRGIIYVVKISSLILDALRSKDS